MSVARILKNKNFLWCLVVTLSALFCLGFALESNYALLFGWCLVFVILMPFLIAIKNKKIDIFEPIYAFVVYVMLSVALRGFFDLKSSSYYLRDLFNINSSYFIGLMATAFVVAIVGLIALYAGYYSRIGNYLTKRTKVITIADWPRSAGIILGLFTFLSGLAALFLIIQSNGGLSVVLQHQREVATSGLYGKYWLLSLLNFPILGICFLYIRTIGLKKSWSEKTILLLNFIPIIFSLTALSFKKNTILLIMALVIFYHYLKNKISIKQLIILFIIFVAIFSFAFNIRSYGWQPSVLVQQIFIQITHPSSIFMPMISRSYLADSAVIILDQLNFGRTAFQFGRPWAELFYWFVPRSIWPDKPLSYSRIFALDFFGHTEIGQTSYVTPGLFGELYLNFAWLGVIGGFFLLGVFFKFIYDFLIKKCHNRLGIFLYGVLFLNLILLLEGPITVQLEFILTNLIMVAFLVLILNLMTSIKNKNENFNS
jgi:oligosaccharide repeat unit polymerase